MSGRLFGSGPEPFDACPDGGRCWHACPGAVADGAKGLPCWRVTHAAPLSTYGEGWTPQDKALHADPEQPEWSPADAEVSDDDLRTLHLPIPEDEWETRPCWEAVTGRHRFGNEAARGEGPNRCLFCYQTAAMLADRYGHPERQGDQR